MHLNRRIVATGVMISSIPIAKYEFSKPIATVVVHVCGYARRYYGYICHYKLLKIGFRLE
jgi:hypothetical protein